MIKKLAAFLLFIFSMNAFAVSSKAIKVSCGFEGHSIEKNKMNTLFSIKPKTKIANSEYDFSWDRISLADFPGWNGPKFVVELLGSSGYPDGAASFELHIDNQKVTVNSYNVTSSSSVNLLPNLEFNIFHIFKGTSLSETRWAIYALCKVVK